MAYWLMKSEPDAYSWQQLQKDKQTQWTGVRNYTARNFLREMKVGDEALFYHSNEGKACVGIMKIAKTAEPDKTVTKDKLTKDGENPWVMVTVAPVKALKTPVTLEMVKAEKRLQDMALIRFQRLSVQPVTAAEWKIVMGMAE